MKTIRLLMLTGLLALAMLASGCVVHEHGYYRHGYYSPRGAHCHGPGCGHEFRGGVWVTVPVIEVR